MYFVLQSKPVG